ncbi:tetracycline-efflux transporter-like protein [Lophium mytilinum]|uniref:Tetracycline-efflux transporter-like protein n=1 Tax=Lophium mytilinum TaxID=390894 RepID=A0A6A6Q8T5_9PEZI|nr:tetracycline-efflux transporter-like protein [Lophium mytilinum]
MPTPYTYQRVADGDEADSGEANGHGSLEFTPSTAERTYSSPPLTQKHWLRRPSVFWLLPTFLLLSIAMGATSMPRMNVLISLICRNIVTENTPASHDPMQGARRHADMDVGGAPSNQTSSAVIVGDYNPQCSVPEVESAAAMLNLWGNLIAGVLGAITLPFWGKLSDHYGRVKPLAASGTLILVSEVVMVLLATLPDSLSLNWVYLTFVLEGLSGSFILVMALASAYAADCTQAEDRNVALGWFHGSMFFGMAVGPAFGGLIGMSGGKSRPLVIFYTGLAMRAFAILFLALVPESLNLSKAGTTSSLTHLKEYLARPSRGSWTEKAKRVNPLRLLQVLRPTHPLVSKSTSRNLIALASINTIMFGAMMGAMNIMMLYSEFRFGWGNHESGIFLSTVNIFRTLATVLVLPLHSSHNSMHMHDPHGSHLQHSWNGVGIDRLDVSLLRASIFSDLVGFLGYALSRTPFLFTASGAVAALGAIGLATAEAAMTKLLPASLTGELLGALGLLQALARIVAPTVGTLVYSWSVGSMPQLVFWGIAVMFGVAGVLTFLLQTDAKAGGEDMVEGEEGISLQTKDDECCE